MAQRTGYFMDCKAPDVQRAVWLSQADPADWGVAGVLDMTELFLKLMIGHAIADFWAQSDALARMKNRHRKPEPPPGQRPQTVWPYALTAHALMHGGAVWVITGSMWLGIAETFAHWVIDFGKCENWYGIHEDQAAHVACKAAWTLLA